ncbi:thermonuclease family protein [Lysinibacillus sp. 3P01SB]|uniref:thermonuclease family protein n=1 Tax=Lysinibacillus sp. 3P01SB TaxID=3132284 RepID=UPI0039A44FA8
MKLKDIKTLITSGTVLLALALYMIFGNPPPEKDEKGQEKQTESALNGSVEESSAIIPLEEAEKVTGNKAVAVEYLSANDGDTISVQMDGEKKRVRLLMIDTPEMNYNKGEPMPYAEDAKAFTIDLLEKAESVELLFDKGPETDHYDRLLAYVYVDGVMLQEELLEEGLAAVRYVNKPNNSLEQHFLDIQEDAEKEGINIWSHEGYFQKDGFHADAIQK